VPVGSPTVSEVSNQYIVSAAIPLPPDYMANWPGYRVEILSAGAPVTLPAPAPSEEHDGPEVCNGALSETADHFATLRGREVPAGDMNKVVTFRTDLPAKLASEEADGCIGYERKKSREFNS
jgi:hypothetical protein